MVIKLCALCGKACQRESVDVGVGIIHGPYGCAECGWSEDPFYDRSSGTSPAQKQAGEEYFVNQYGVMQKIQKCTTCTNSTGDFTDLASYKEFLISGMCQHCQDSVFQE